MNATLCLELTLEEAAALYHLIGNSTRDHLRKTTMSEARMEMLMQIYNQLPAFRPPEVTTPR